MARTTKDKLTPRKTRKDAVVPIRMTHEQKELLVGAAQDAGMGLSTWLLSLGLKQARR